MPISVLCPGCQTRFSVSDKFGGKQGPCPKCKTVIKIPEVSDEPAVEVHAPEEYGGGKVGGGPRSSTRPIARQEVRVTPVKLALGIAGAVGVLVIAWAGHKVFQNSLPLRAVGLLLISPPLVVAGYSFLRNDELAAYRGMELWIRATVCALVYVLMWGAFYLFLRSDLANEFAHEAWYWVFILPPFLGVGTLAASYSLDLEFGSGFFHYCFYLIVTVIVGYAAHLQMPWHIVVR